MAVLITLHVVRGAGVGDILTELTSVPMAFNPQYITSAESLVFADQPSNAKTTFSYASPSSGRGADQIDVTEPLSAIETLANA